MALVGLCDRVVLGLVDTPVLRDKRVFVLVHCWVSGAALVVPVGPYVHGWLQCLWLFVCGVVLCENCIVDASIFLFCVLVFIPVCLCVRVFCYGRMVDALAC